MGVFALDERTGVSAFRVLFTPIGWSVHWAEYVGLAVFAGTFILYGTGVVDRLNPVVGSLEVGTVAGLVAQTPHDDGGVVAVDEHVVLLAVHMLLGKLRIFRQGLVAVAHAVAFDVGLRRHIDAVFVAKVIPARVILVVTRAHGVHVHALHHLNVLFHAAHRNHIAAVGVKFVTVDTLYKHRLAVDKQLLVLYLDATEADTLSYHFENGGATFKSHIEVIQDGHLSRPGENAAVQTKPFLGIVGPFVAVVFIDRAAVGSFQFYFEAAARGVFHVNLITYPCLTLLIIIILLQLDVADVGFGTGVEVGLAGNAREAPEILVFQIGTVAPTHHLHGNEIFLARHQVLRQVKLGSSLAVLAVTDIFAVDPHRQVRRSRAHVHEDVHTLPVLRNNKLAAVGAGVVVQFLDVGRFAFKLRGPRVAHVLVYAVAVAFDFEQSGYGKLHPLAVVIVCLVETCRRIVVVFHPKKFPHAFNRHEAL